MLRTTQANAWLKRTLRPLYAFAQATPKSMFLDPAWDRSVAIWPGMVVMRTTGQNVTLLNGTGFPYGLVTNYIGGDSIDELLDAGINATGVWVLSADAEFEVFAPAFDNTLTWTDPGDGTNVLVYASTAGANRGKLVPAGATNASTKPVARLLQVESATSIVIGGLVGTSA
jgi:hypothetical protein